MRGREKLLCIERNLSSETVRLRLPHRCMASLTAAFTTGKWWSTEFAILCCTYNTLWIYGWCIGTWF